MRAGKYRLLWLHDRTDSEKRTILFDTLPGRSTKIAFMSFNLTLTLNRVHVFSRRFQIGQCSVGTI